MLKPTTIILAAGGTGGHMFPAFSLANILEKQGHNPQIITDKRGAKYCQNISYNTLPLGSINRRGLGILNSAYQLLISFVRSFNLIRRLNPAAVVGFGGYSSAPTIAAAILLKIPIVLFEADSRLGIVNRAAQSWAKTIAWGTAPKTPNPKYITTGMPLRPEFITIQPAPYSPPTSTINLLIIGGSQGARFISSVIPNALAKLPIDLRKRLNVSQQARPELTEQCQNTYAHSGIKAEVQAFFQDIPQRLNAAHLVISRAGASSLAEIAYMGRPALLIPYAQGIDSHQSENAKILASRKAGWHIDENATNDLKLVDWLEKTLSDHQNLKSTAANVKDFYYPNAAEKLAESVLKVIYL